MRAWTLGLVTAALAGCAMYEDEDSNKDSDRDLPSFDERRDLWRTQPEHIYPPYIVPYAPVREDLYTSGRSAGMIELEDQEYDERLGRDRILILTDDLEWKEGPDWLPQGARVVVLSGDPMDEGLYTTRLRLPAGWKIGVHSHARNESVTVLSGTLNLGFGEEFAKDRAKTLSAGSYAFIPAGMNHYAWVDEETVLQIHGRGPKDIRYMKIDDDPRKK